MAERYYRFVKFYFDSFFVLSMHINKFPYFISIHPDENSKVYMNYNVIQAQAPAQHMNNLVGMTTTQINNEYDYLANTTYYTTVANTISTNGGGGVVDINNNRSSGRYYNMGGVGCGGKQNVCGGGGVNLSAGNIYTNKVLPSSLMTKYTNAGSYMHCGGSGIGAMMTPHLPASNETGHHTHYNNHANSSSYGYQRNRYMPYNRSNTSNALHHNPLHNTTAITTCGGLSSTSAVSSGYHQFTAPIYQTCSPGAGMMHTLTSTAPLSAVSAQQTQLHPHSMTSTMATSTHCNTTGQEFTYAHAVAASLAPPSSTVTTAVPTSDNKNTISLTTVVTTSGGSSSSSGGGPVITSTPYNGTQSYATVSDPNDTVTLQITNLDYSMDEVSLRNFLLNQLKPITPVVSLTFEGSSYAKVTVPDLYVR